ncbi:18 kDa seed maturation protein-like [Magnolia sinica]|uniref:18 kDa seed maturation protein-like n=1 Tax=Magnolia sinica TaxID=86752 RepID=UPI0026582917|nr:18 kDa seed maturation protein-like [Magnolia sinica]
MQAGKNAAASMKETAGNIATSAKAGMDKTKATVQGKAEKTTSHDPLEKQMAEERKEEKITQAEINKLQAKEQNAAAKESARAGQTGTVTLHPTAALPGHGTGQPHGQVTSGVVGSHPTATNTGTGTTTARNPLAGGTDQTGYGTGGGHS